MKIDRLCRLVLCCVPLILLTGCAQEIREEMERRNQVTENKLLRIQDKTLSAESRLDELNAIMIEMNSNLSQQLATLSRQVDEIEQQNSEMRQSTQTSIDNLQQKITALEKTTNDKLKIILDEVLKENQRIIKRIRTIEEEVYGEATRPIITDTGESASAIIESGDRKLIQHRVRSGENLWSIAQNYGVSMEDIAEANNMESISDIIKPGQILTIPVKE